MNVALKESHLPGRPLVRPRLLAATPEESKLEACASHSLEVQESGDPDVSTAHETTLLHGSFRCRCMFHGMLDEHCCHTAWRSLTSTAIGEKFDCILLAPRWPDHPGIAAKHRAYTRTAHATY
jgi:hypothetical protein